MKNNLKKFTALVKREFIEHKNGYFWIPTIIIGIVLAILILTLMGVGRFQMGELEVHGITNLSDGLMRLQEEAGNKDLPFGAKVAGIYWVPMIPAAVALGFVVFFSLLGSLYEERRDRSVLFFKSMPVSDTQEVLAKLVTAIFVAPLVFLAIVIVGQLIIATLLSLVVMVQGGPAGLLWPLGDMIASWISMFLFYALFVLWVLPNFAWLLLVSSFAPRMPFVFAILPPIVLVIVEKIFFGSEHIGNLLDSRGEDFAAAIQQSLPAHDTIVMSGITARMSFDVFFSGLGNSLASGSFWGGLLVAGAMLWGAIELRKRSLAL